MTNTAAAQPNVYSRTTDKIIPDRRPSIGRPVVIGLLTLWIAIFWVLCGAVVYFYW